jgi:integration host factor subunit beta
MTNGVIDTITVADSSGDSTTAKHDSETCSSEAAMASCVDCCTMLFVAEQPHTCECFPSVRESEARSMTTLSDQVPAAGFSRLCLQDRNEAPKARRCCDLSCIMWKGVGLCSALACPFLSVRVDNCDFGDASQVNEKSLHRRGWRSWKPRVDSVLRKKKLQKGSNFVASSAAEMTKSDLAVAVARRLGLSMITAEMIVDEIFTSIIAAFRRDECVYLRGFGSLMIRHYKPYVGRNPKTGAIVKIGRKRLPSFLVSEEMRRRVNKIQEPAVRIAHSGPGVGRKSSGVTGVWESVEDLPVPETVEEQAVLRGK